MHQTEVLYIFLSLRLINFSPQSSSLR